MEVDFVFFAKWVVGKRCLKGHFRVQSLPQGGWPRPPSRMYILPPSWMYILPQSRMYILDVHVATCMLCACCNMNHTGLHVGETTWLNAGLGSTIGRVRSTPVVWPLDTWGLIGWQSCSHNTVACMHIFDIWPVSFLKEGNASQTP